jgi:hypothetical protein
MFEGHNLYTSEIVPQEYNFKLKHRLNDVEERHKTEAITLAKLKYAGFLH